MGKLKVNKDLCPTDHLNLNPLFYPVMPHYFWEVGWRGRNEKKHGRGGGGGEKLDSFTGMFTFLFQGFI